MTDDDTDRAAEERAADERDQQALIRFFGHVLGSAPKPSCNRGGSSQRPGKGDRGPGRAATKPHRAHLARGPRKRGADETGNR